MNFIYFPTVSWIYLLSLYYFHLIFSLTMSVEALLAEVTPIVALRSVIEAAESIYFHDRRALSDVKPETSHGGHHDNQHGWCYR